MGPSQWRQATTHRILKQRRWWRGQVQGLGLGEHTPGASKASTRCRPPSSLQLLLRMAHADPTAHCASATGERQPTCSAPRYMAGSCELCVRLSTFSSSRTLDSTSGATCNSGAWERGGGGWGGGCSHGRGEAAERRGGREFKRWSPFPRVRQASLSRKSGQGRGRGGHSPRICWPCSPPGARPARSRPRPPPRQRPAGAPAPARPPAGPGPGRRAAPRGGRCGPAAASRRRQQHLRGLRGGGDWGPENKTSVRVWWRIPMTRSATSVSERSRHFCPAANAAACIRRIKLGMYGVTQQL